jgi:hypothetical protein
MSEKIKFLIVSRKRTGSTMLRTALDSHPNIRCLGEIFRIDKPLTERPGTLKTIKKLNPIKYNSSEELERSIRDKPINFFDSVLEKNSRMLAFGCKIFKRHHEKLVKEAISRDDFRIIILCRDNQLALYSSQKVADKTGRHNIFKSDLFNKYHKNPNKVKFNQDEFVKYRNRVRRFNDFVEMIIENAICPVMKLEYATLIKMGNYEDVLNFLEVNPKVPIQPKTVKRNDGPIENRFLNPDEVKSYLHKIGKISWLDSE